MVSVRDLSVVATCVLSVVVGEAPLATRPDTNSGPAHKGSQNPNVSKAKGTKIRNPKSGRSKEARDPKSEFDQLGNPVASGQCIFKISHKTITATRGGNVVSRLCALA